MSIKLAMKTVLILSIVSGCSSKPIDSTTIPQTGLKDCPDTNNCVSSETDDTRHKIEPFHLKGDTKESWLSIQQVLAAMPRTKIILATENTIHAECRSRIFRFVDDLELHLNPSNKRISIRSASRLGYSDFGVNRRRVEYLRHKLHAHNIIE
ncbi:MAG: DUF1499 domain-containing protein [Thermodesulfobacteriota bacterium]|nr:DUF1499 domain-containing protein [Thermodesulfobacteriota bacterium]